MRKELTKFRISAHSLKIETGLRNKTEVNKGIGEFCVSGEIEKNSTADFRSLDRFILNFPRRIIKLKPMLGCKIPDIAMKRLFLLV